LDYNTEAIARVVDWQGFLSDLTAGAKQRWLALLVSFGIDDAYYVLCGECSGVDLVAQLCRQRQ